MNPWIEDKWAGVKWRQEPHPDWLENSFTPLQGAQTRWHYLFNVILVIIIIIITILIIVVWVLIFTAGVLIILQGIQGIKAANVLQDDDNVLSSFRAWREEHYLEHQLLDTTLKN